MNFGDKSFPPETTNASWNDIRRSRPKLDTRVATYAAILANTALEESEDALHALAFLDEVISPPVGHAVNFRRLSGFTNSDDIATSIKRLRRRGVFHSKARCADWITPLAISRTHFDTCYESRWSPWGFYLWTFVEGLMASGTIRNGRDIPRVHVNNTARDLQWVIEEFPGYGDWLRGKKAPRDCAKREKILREIAEAHPEHGNTLAKQVWLLGRYLCVMADKRLPEYADFGGRRYLRVLRELRALEGFDSSGTTRKCVFFKDDQCVGELTFGESYQVIKASLAGFATQRIENHVLDSFSVEESFRRQGIGQVMIRHAMSRGVRWVGSELAGALEPLMIRHGIRQCDGAVELERTHWGEVEVLNS